MARKSRKNMMPQAAAQEAVQQNEKELLRTAAYPLIDFHSLSIAH